MQAYALQTIRLLKARLCLQGRCDCNVARHTQAHFSLTVVATALVKSSKNLTSLIQQIYYCQKLNWLKYGYTCPWALDSLLSCSRGGFIAS